ncbi:hypothetical protein EGW08_013901 [Elysia chlorotica]|uniref:Major facilitator superfamily (MFS) profile domain-containing protein n=1 Tax=Elysia chlorotica TaxID=188477 RepID=A0A433T9Z7_ELYCH|nr:hypothetical protein EGW08_013901 [Elysia chlorotica]
MSGTAPWCESVGPVDSIARLNPVPTRRFSNDRRGHFFYPGSINTDNYYHSAVTAPDEEESRTIRDLLLSMSLQTPSASVAGVPVYDPSGKRAPHKAEFFRSESQVPARSSSCLLPGHRSTSDPTLAPDALCQYQGYGSISSPPTVEFPSTMSSAVNKPCGTSADGGHDPGGDGIQKLPFFMISLIVMSLGVSSKFHSTLLDQYVYQRYAIDIIGNVTNTASDPCFKDSQDNDTQASLVRSISRKLQLFIPLFGYNVKTAGMVALIYLDVDINWFYLPFAVEGLSGNFVGVLLGLFLYTSDISGRSRSRTTAMVILEGVRGSTSAALNIAAGELIEYSGFELPAWISMAFSAAALMLILALPKRKPQTVAHAASDKKSSLPIDGEDRGCCRKYISVFLFPAGTFSDRNVKKMFRSGLMAAFLLLVTYLGIKKVQSLYLMNEPICWSSSLIGWFSFAGDLSSNLFTIFLGPLLIRCLPGMIVGVFGLLSFAGGCIFLALATTGYELFFQPAVVIATPIPMGIIRGELSRLVGAEAQGTLFATIAVMESFSFALGAGFLYVYNATLAFYKGTVALLGASMLALAAFILIYFHRVWLKHYRE